MKDLEMHQIQICNYEKEIEMQVIKLKEQQNLCETLRTERTLYSKNLIEAKVEGYIFPCACSCFFPDLILIC